MKGWYDTDQNRGFMVIGVHAPEFGFDKDIDNVKRDIKEHDIVFPVPIDNNFSTWHRTEIGTGLRCISATSVG